MIPSQFHPTLPNVSTYQYPQHSNNLVRLTPHVRSHHPQITNIFTSQVSCTYISCITIIAVLFTNKFGMYKSEILDPNLRSIRFFELLLVNGMFGFIMFFSTKFKTIQINHIHFSMLIILLNIIMAMYFYHCRNTHSSFDQFVHTIMYTYTS